jgi:hypothetical protein
MSIKPAPFDHLLGFMSVFSLAPLGVRASTRHRLKAVGFRCDWMEQIL